MVVFDDFKSGRADKTGDAGTLDAASISTLLRLGRTGKRPVNFLRRGLGASLVDSL